MGFWLFGRKHRRDSQIEEQGFDRVAHKEMGHKQSGQFPGDPRTSNRAMTSTDGKRQGERPKRLTKIDRSKVRDPGLSSVPRSSTVPQAPKAAMFPQNLREKSETFPTPPTNPFVSPSENSQNDVYQQNPASQSSIGQDFFSVGQRPPTLKAKRSSTDAGMPRRKTSKRKAQDHAREQEIRAMSSPVPAPKRTLLTGGPLRRDTKKIPGGLNRHLERPTSEVSLPIPESLTSSNDGVAEYAHSFKVSAFDILSPRPTVRYTENPRYRPARSTNPSRASEKRPAIPEEDAKDSKRIDDIADSLDSSTLRELMERDRRRREKKQRADQEKLERRLQRRADRQRQEEERQAAIASSPRAAAATLATSRETPLGLGIAAGAEAVNKEKASDLQPAEDAKPSQPWPGDASNEAVAHENPFADEKSDVPFALEKRTSIGVDRSFLRAESPMDTRMSQASLVSTSPPRSPAQAPRDRASMSQLSGLHREPTPDIPEHMELGASRRDSDQSAVQSSSWTTFFRRGGTRSKRTSADRGRSGPTEFSNTSRESFPRQGPPPSLPPRSFRRSGTPVRTQSKFREDLPDFPLSPPDSRVQSPEAVAIPPKKSSEVYPESGDRSKVPEGYHSESLGVHNMVTDSETPNFDPAGGLSQSMASVDSEGSWLTGRPNKRSSLGLAHPLRQSETSLPAKQPSHGEEEDIANDEYLSRLTPAPDNRRESGSAIRRASSTILGHPDFSDDEPEVPPVPESYLNDADTTWHGGVARHPTVVRQYGRIKSREGLLNDFNDASSRESNATDDEEEIVTPSSPHERQATSVDYGRGHARQISAGSAKLLDIRRSMDSHKRLSSADVSSTARNDAHIPEEQES